MATTQLQESIKARFHATELQLAAAIGGELLDLKVKVERLFREIPDPLLAAQDVRGLLHIADETDAIVEALTELTQEGVLEKTTTTQRALDPEGIALYRLKDVEIKRLKVYGTASRISLNEIRLQFTLDGRAIRSFAAIDRLDAIAGTGNQRDEIVKHVKAIAQGMEDGVQVPNSVILIFHDNVFAWDPKDGDVVPESFVVCRSLAEEWSSVPHPSMPGRIVQDVKAIELDIPYRTAAFDSEKTALLVDGQQRTAALSLVDIEVVPSYQLSVNALVGDASEAKQTFRVANNTVKITSDFSRALLGAMDDAPGYVKQERLVAQAVKRLALDDQESPFFGLVKHPGVAAKKEPIVYNTLFAVTSAFEQSGLDFDDNFTRLADCVKRGFVIVKEVWPQAWGISSSLSKLMHGAGLRAMSRVLVDLIDSNHRNHGFDIDAPGVWSETRESIKRLSTRVQWTEDALQGTKDQKSIYINDILNKQNTNQDIEKLTTFLQKEVTLLDKKASTAPR
ncbi:DGQHR domain-containing protein [Variovorax sp. J22R133]|uniref:DGQHR domain-containing protein n=1 Tax=Variovorax brevis TaxID=3053503 RepID=UPI002574DE65|nr:DGQHR domain-containing protein [Variovorax sp. J22R133]MDM0116144.1 DGQHR domain-containing protein [Variovorax sp. J22R133]